MACSSCGIFILTLIFVIIVLAQPLPSKYKLVSKYTSDNFFQTFSAFTDPDPTLGKVDFVDLVNATSDINNPLMGYITNENNAVLLRVDHIANSPRRRSVRVESNQIFDSGSLFIADIVHIPAMCSVWPAFWLLGPDWPSGGEINIIEGINTQSGNLMAVHTTPGCIVDNATATGAATSLMEETDCEGNVGCFAMDQDSRSFGAEFNSHRGGVFAAQWERDAVRIWFFPRSEIPGDIAGGQPDPSSWPTPQASFSGSGCDLGSHLGSMQIVFDITLCGGWAGKPEVWEGFSECVAAAPDCDSYVANNGPALKEAYWAINSVSVWEH